MPASNSRGGACWFWSHSSKLSKHPGVEDVLLSGVVVAAIVVVAWPARSQSSTTQGAIDPAECAGHRRPFPAGRIGFAGSKSGPTVTRSDTTAPEATRSQPSGDQSKVPGLPGRKSGPTLKPSDGQVSGLRHSKLDQPAIWDDERPSQLPQPRHCAGQWWGSAGSQPCRCRAGARRLNERSRPPQRGG
jgi:hypothetical protein